MGIIKKENWQEDHMNSLHTPNYGWCPLCVARKEGDDNPQQHLTPPQQDPSQTGLKYLKANYKPDEEYAGVITSGDHNTDDDEQ